MTLQRRGLLPTRPGGPVSGRCRDFQNRYGAADRARFALMLWASAYANLLTCTALAVLSFAATLAPHEDGKLLHLSHTLMYHRADPPARITVWLPVIAVAWSDDSQQHGASGTVIYRGRERWQDRLLVYQQPFRPGGDHDADALTPANFSRKLF